LHRHSCTPEPERLRLTLASCARTRLRADFCFYRTEQTSATQAALRALICAVWDEDPRGARPASIV
jgi:hypothetical protein